MMRIRLDSHCLLWRSSPRSAAAASAAAVPGQRVVSRHPPPAAPRRHEDVRRARPTWAGSTAAPAPNDVDPLRVRAARRGACRPGPERAPETHQLGSWAERRRDTRPTVRGAIGPDYFVQGVNYDGRRGLPALGPRARHGPGPAASFANAPAGQEVLDSQFLWDEPAQRWFYSFTYKAGSGEHAHVGDPLRLVEDSRPDRPRARLVPDADRHRRGLRGPARSSARALPTSCSARTPTRSTTA